MYGRIGVNAKKQMNYVNRNIRRHKLTNRNYYIYSYDGETAYNIDEEEYYDDGFDPNNKEEWDEYPELEDINEEELDDNNEIYDEDGELWEKYNGNLDSDIGDSDLDDYDEECECDDEDCCCDYEITIDPKKALMVSAGVIAGVVAIGLLLKKRR